MKKFLMIIGLVFAILLCLGLYFGMIAACVWLVCWVLGIVFTWRYVVIAYLIYLLLFGGGISIQIGR